MIRSIISILLLGLLACSYHEKPTKPFIRIAKSPPDKRNNTLRLDGLYSLTGLEDGHIMDSLLTRRKEGIIDPILFYGNGIFIDLGYKSVYTAAELESIFERFLAKGKDRTIGVFTLEDSLISASGYNTFMGRGGSLSYHYLCYYEGIASGNKIFNWRMVAPYPGLSKLEQSFVYNTHLLTYLKTPKTYTFRPFPGKTRIDSVGVGILEYRKE